MTETSAAGNFQHEDPKAFSPSTSVPARNRRVPDPGPDDRRGGAGFRSIGRWVREVVLCSLLLASLISCAQPPLPPAGPPPVTAPPPTLEPVSWDEVEGWENDEPGPALEAFLQSCRALGRKPDWQEVCADARSVTAFDQEGVRDFFRERFVPHRVCNGDGSDTGTITGYYVPDIDGSRTPSEQYRYPIYARPEDMLVIDFGSLYPELKNLRMRGRVERGKVVPYYSRGEIDGEGVLAGNELFWVTDPVELFFLHIQGSGRIRLENDERIMVNYADQNGHPYSSLGKILIAEKELPAEGMSMQRIRAWAAANPERSAELLARNASYIFFRELAPDVQSPPGALGVTLTPERSLAVDPRYIPLGAPVFLATSWPNTNLPLDRLMVAQDTGGAIKGAVRGDFFWGVGDLAGEYAGRMKQQGRFWVLLPREISTLPQ